LKVFQSSPEFTSNDRSIPELWGTVTVHHFDITVYYTQIYGLHEKNEITSIPTFYITTRNEEISFITQTPKVNESVDWSILKVDNFKRLSILNQAFFSPFLVTGGKVVKQLSAVVLIPD
jgi:hypothetical protein